MLAIIQTVTKTFLLDYAIEAFFDKVLVNFSNFDILNGYREFDLIQITNYAKDGSRTNLRFYTKCKILSISEGKSSFMVAFDWSYYGQGRVSMIRFNRVISCDDRTLIVEHRL